MKPVDANFENSIDADRRWKGLFRAAGAGVLLAVVLMLLDIVLSFTGGDVAVGGWTAADWFEYLQEEPFLGLRNLGLFNVANMIFTAPLYLALYRLHRSAFPASAALALMLFLLGAAVYISNNGALIMLSLSSKFAGVSSPVEMERLVNAGTVILAQAEDFTPGSFPGFLLSSLASLIAITIMTRGSVFHRWIGLTGLVGTSCLLAFTVSVTFFPATFDLAMIAAIFGGLLMLVWNVAVALRLFQLAPRLDPSLKKIAVPGSENLGWN